MFTAKPAQFDFVRKLILTEPERWLNAIKATEQADYRSAAGIIIRKIACLMHRKSLNNI
jgi:hypothetical protein